MGICPSLRYVSGHYADDFVRYQDMTSNVWKTLPPVIYTCAAIYLASFASYRPKFRNQGIASGDEKRLKGNPPSRKTVEHSERPSHATRALLFGAPDPKSPACSWASLLINLLIALGTADQIYRGPFLYGGHDLSFARTGYVSESSARILVREPNEADYPISVSYQLADVPTEDWKDGGAIQRTSKDTDYTASLFIDSLEVDTRYRYVTSTNHSGEFRTGPSPGTTGNIRDKTFTFLTSSCIKPNFPYNPLTHPLTMPGLRILSDLLPSLGARFMLFLGDFIYVDVPHRLGSDIETYRREYRMVYRSPDWPSASQNLPWLHVLDDHEIANDWDGNTTGVYQAAVDPWTHYHTSVNPPPLRPGSSYFSFTQGPASFFMMDTRRYRSPEFAAPHDSPSKTMLGKEQLEDLLRWLREPLPEGVRWRIIASSIPFTKNWRFGSADTWAGYLAERQQLLEAMWDVSAQTGTGVVIISGDRHEFAATSFPPPKGDRWPSSAAVHEYSTSPLNQFYLPVRTYRQEDDEDVVLKYLPDGNSKVGAIDITLDGTSRQSILKFRLFIDGTESWNHTLAVSM